MTSSSKNSPPVELYEENASLREEALYWRTKFEQLSYHVQCLFQVSTTLSAYEPPKTRSAAARAIRSAALSSEERDQIKQTIHLRDRAFRLEGDVANAEERLAASEQRVRELEHQVSELKLRLVVGFQAAVNGPQQQQQLAPAPVIAVKERATQTSSLSPAATSNPKKTTTARTPPIEQQVSSSATAPKTAASATTTTTDDRDAAKFASAASIFSSDEDEDEDNEDNASKNPSVARSKRDAPVALPPARKAPALPLSASPVAAPKSIADLGQLPIRIIGSQNYLPVKHSVVRVQALARGWLARRWLRAGRLLTRGSLVLELCSTERKYVADLRTILTQFAAPLAAGLSAPASQASRAAAAAAALSTGGSNGALSSPSLSSANTPSTTNAAMLADLRRVFSPLEVILLYNENFLEALEQRLRSVDHFPATAKVGDVISQFADFLRCYVNYVTTFGQSLAVLAKCRENSLFQRLERECDVRVIEQVASELAVSADESAADPSLPSTTATGIAASLVSSAASSAAMGAGFTVTPRAGIPSGPQLNSLLIKPIQRIPRYILLIEQLIKYTPNAMKDKQLLIDSLKIMKGVGDKLNESKREAEQFAAVVCVYRCLFPKEDEIADLVQPHRRFLREGAFRWWRDKLVGAGEAEVENKECRLFLFNDCLVIAQSKKGPGSGSGDVVAAALSGADAQLAAALGSFASGSGGSSTASLTNSFKVLAYVVLAHVTSVVSIPNMMESSDESVDLQSSASATPRNLMLLDTEKRSVTLVAATAEQRDLWVKLISETLKELQSNISTLRR